MCCSCADSVPKMTACRAKTGAVNSNMTSDFKPGVVVWSKLRMRSEKSPKLAKAASDG